MNSNPRYYIVEASALPEVFLKVAEAKRLLATGEANTVNEAARMTDISRSAFYKYRDAVHPLYENTRGKTVTVSMNLDHTPGLLSSVLNGVAGEGANILTINQTIPINGIANVTLCIETNEMQGEFSRLVNKIEITVYVFYQLIYFFASKHLTGY